MAYQYKQQDWLKSLLAAAHARQPNPATKQSHEKDSLRAAVALIESLSALQQDQGDNSSNLLVAQVWNACAQSHLTTCSKGLYLLCCG